MTETRSEVLERLLRAYAQCYDIERTEEENAYYLAATAYFCSRSEKYVLVKSAQLWAAESYEYMYLFSVPKLTREIFEKGRDYAYQDGMSKIKPHSEHMYTYITALFLCEEADDDAVRELKKCHIYKSFKFSLHGWMEFHTAALELGKERVWHNRSGRDAAKFIRKYILKPKVKKR